MTILTTSLVSMISLPAIAQAETSFQTPTGNIHCTILQANIRCDILKITAKIPPKPRSCEFDWGHAFILDAQGRGYRGCYGDTTVNPQNPVLQYGKTLRHEGIVCTSRRTGLTCVNRDQRGWELSREKQRFF
ncbi:hypothetical protein H6G77_20380 [Aulosira sp. FACHB-615]|nr:hypothetical protein [Nostoc sp. FACHB-190]MBD2489880.1 hypothetical protein [Aulosira sp. FACHB-615]